MEPDGNPKGDTAEGAGGSERARTHTCVPKKGSVRLCLTFNTTDMQKSLEKKGKYTLLSRVYFPYTKNIHDCKL